MILIVTRLYRAWRARQRSGDGSKRAVAAAVVSAPANGGAAVMFAPANGGAAVVSAPRPSAASRGGLGLLGHQVRYDLLASMRNPRARFFTFFFPVLLLVVFAGVFGHGTTTVDGVRVPLSRFYVAGILAMSIITAAYSNLVVSVATARETGVLKRRRATPVPPALLIAGQALSTLAIAAVMATILLVIARVGYQVSMPVGGLVAIACTLVVGTLSFACLGYAVAGMIGSLEAAQPIVQATTMPLYFISGVWIPTVHLGHTLRSIASLFPIEHLAAAMHLASVQTSVRTALSPKDLLVLGVWALAAAAFAARRFSWLPSTVTA